jgi:predicted DNA-binding transcriptional regulator AlpA
LQAINITLNGLEEAIRAIVRDEIRLLKVEADEELLDIDGCVAYTGWTRQTIYDLRSDGVLKRRGIKGGKVLHTRSDLDAAMRRDPGKGAS